MAKRKTYTDWEKQQAISLAGKIGVPAASKQLGIPESTLRNWMAKHTPPSKTGRAAPTVRKTPAPVQTSAPSTLPETGTSPDASTPPETGAPPDAPVPPEPPAVAGSVPAQERKPLIPAVALVVIGVLFFASGMRLLLSLQLGAALLGVGIGVALLYVGLRRYQAGKGGGTGAEAQPQQETAAQSQPDRAPAVTDPAWWSGLLTDKKRRNEVLGWVICVFLVILTIGCGSLLSGALLGLGALIACPLFREKAPMAGKVWIPAVACLFVIGVMVSPEARTAEPEAPANIQTQSAAMEELPDEPEEAPAPEPEPEPEPEVQAAVLEEPEPEEEAPAPLVYPRDYHAAGMDAAEELDTLSDLEPGDIVLLSGVVRELRQAEMGEVPCQQMVLETESGALAVQEVYSYFSSEDGDAAIVTQLDADGGDYTLPAEGENVQVYAIYTDQTDEDGAPVFYYGASEAVSHYVVEQIELAAAQEAAAEQVEQTESAEAETPAAEAEEPAVEEAPVEEEPEDEDASIIVYVTKTGEKYHRGDCRYLKKSKIEISLSEARGRYEPCSVCDPPA